MTPGETPEGKPPRGLPPRLPRSAAYVLIVLASILPHLKGVASPVLDYHYHRQANTAAIARNYHEDGLPFLHPRISWDGKNSGRAATEFPLYMWLVGLFWNLFGLGDLWGRVLSIAFSALTAVVIFRFLEDGLGTDPAFWGSVFFGTLPVEIYFGRTVQPEAFALLATAFALYSLNRYLNSLSPSPQPPPAANTAAGKAALPAGGAERILDVDNEGGASSPAASPLGAALRSTAGSEMVSAKAEAIPAKAAGLGVPSPDEKAKGEGTPLSKFIWWLLSILSAALAIGHKLPYAYLLGVCAAMIFFRLGRKAFSNPWLWAYPIWVAAPVILWYRYAATAAAYVVPTSQGGFLQQLDYAHLPYFIFYQTFSRFPELTATYSGLLLFGIGAIELLRRRGQWFFGAWWLCVWCCACFGGGYAFQHEYAALPFALVNPAFMGVGFCALREKINALAGSRKKWAVAGFALLVLGMPVHAALRLHRWYKLNHPFLLRIGPVIDRISSKDDLFLCNQRASSLYLYHIDRQGWSWSLIEEGAGRLSRVDQAIAQGARFFLTEKEDVFADRNNPIAKYFYERFPALYEDSDAIILRLEPAQSAERRN